MKQKILNIIGVTAFTLALGALAFGMVFLLEESFQTRQKQDLATCKQIAKLAGSSEYKLGENNNCLIIKSDKFVEVKN